MIEKELPVLKRIYEHPFNERMRLLLRLEIIFSQAINHQQARDQYEMQLCLDALFALLNITNRYELRAELLRELEHIRSMLISFQRAGEGDMDNISKVFEELKDCSDTLHRLDSKHIDRIRNIEFLNTVKNRNVHDTGSYLFELPALQHWLLQPSASREEQIKIWLDDFIPLKQSIDFLLRLTRESSSQEKVIAEKGVYIKTVNSRSSSYQLLRIILPENDNIYPRVSGDKFRFAIRFMQQKQMTEKASQTARDVEFILQTCGI